MSSVGTFGQSVWRDLGGDPKALDSVHSLNPSVSLASRLDVIGLAGDSVALAALAVHEVLAARGTVASIPPVRISGDRLATSIRSERSFRLDGEPPSVWAPLSGFFQTDDGWVRAHGNYPHHAARLRALLGLGGEASNDDVAAAFRSTSAQEIEDEAAVAGAIAVRVRTPEEWESHAQARSLAPTPVIRKRSLSAGPRRAWDAAELPLGGVRVLDLTRVIAGPVASRDLAFAGADVLRIDSPSLPEIPWQHLDTGQGKRSALLDLRAPADRSVFEDLLGHADVVITGYRPGGLDALGLSPEALAERRPGLVVGGVSAWGTIGPWSERRGFDSIVQAASGIAMVESDDGTTPGALPAQVLDHSAGHFLAAGLIRALVENRDTGQGASIEVALARIAQELQKVGATEAKRPDSQPRLTTQAGLSGDEPLITAAPVLTFAGAPSEYPAMGGLWGSDPAAWRET